MKILIKTETNIEIENMREKCIWLRSDIAKKLVYK